MTRELRALPAFALVALICAGCGSTAPSETNTAADPVDSDAAKKVSAQEKGVKFAQCMRAHGVPHFPDPDTKGATNFGVDVSPEVFTKAAEACKDLAPPGALSSKRTPKQQSGALEFAACIRSHGVKDFPDPVNGEPLINTYKIPSSDRPGGMAILNATIKTCRKLLDRAAAGQ